MAGIAGIARGGERARVEKMLDKISHRGRAGREIVEKDGATLGLVVAASQTDALEALRKKAELNDAAGAGHGARVRMTRTGLAMERDPLGVAPLYHGRTEDGAISFASEVKALAGTCRSIVELLPGRVLDESGERSVFELKTGPLVDDPPEAIARELRDRLDAAVLGCIRKEETGSWLSGGLDSSSLAALARPKVKRLHTFTAGLPDAPDLAAAREAAAFIDSEHHEARLGFNDLIRALPDVIYHLESFDALLVRSSLTNYLVARLASDYVSDVFSGEAGDELFAGYDYLKSLDPAALPDELIDITGRLHNTAFQRVDRCASAHGTVAHVAFADPRVVEYALRIPVGLKLRDGVEKWILRRALEGALPEPILNRPKVKFWEGAGVGARLADHAEAAITDADFARERRLANGWILNTKEELFYYRIFAERVGGGDDLSWMGRTKGAPAADGAGGGRP